MGDFLRPSARARRRKTERDTITAVKKKDARLKVSAVTTSAVRWR